jgi:hypothetical protein
MKDYNWRVNIFRLEHIAICRYCQNNIKIFYLPNVVFKFVCLKI